MTSVLIVDDDPAFRTTIGRDLGDQGFTVALAQNADEATELLAGRAIDVLLTDLRMPGEDGIDLLAKVRTVAPRTRAILMSGYASARDYQRAIECGAVRVLSKPFTPSELLQAIRQAVECETGFRGSIHGLSLVDLLQMFHYARRSLAIVVDGLAPGHVFLEDGLVIHAVYRELQGEPALRAILAMPAGSLRTMVLPQATPHSITRDFQTLLLDSLRTVDEAAVEDPEWNFEGLSEPAIASSPDLERVVERLRRLDGYVAALMVDYQTGIVLGGDGDLSSPEVQTAAAGYCELYRLERSLVDQLAGGDEIVDVVITLSSQYHVLHAIAGQPSLVLCVVLDRAAASLGFARYAIAAVDRGGAP
ncbi:MAG TPA: response regulator [Kofleriaceae bacterium]|jgi:CheY-like chemotaxis protein|nr:response regulator [Kofleriaceae bacterium]